MQKRGFGPCTPGDIESPHEYRKEMIANYRNEKYQIMMHQYSIVNTLTKFLQNVKMGIDVVQASAMVALCSHNDLYNLLNERLYVKSMYKASLDT